MKHLPLGVISEYYQTAHFIRPVQPRIAQEFANLMKAGAEFPAITLGHYPDAAGGQGKLIVDGVLRYRAAQIAKLDKYAVEIKEYESLADALADQLKANIAHGVRLSPAQRDTRIRMLAEVYNWPVRRIAAAIGLHFSSVSRIARKKQNMTGTGKGGRPKGHVGQVVAHALPPRVFLRTIQNIHLTLSKAPSKTMILAAIHDPKRVKDLPKTIALLQQVATEVNDFLAMATSAVAEVEAAA